MTSVWHRRLAGACLGTLLLCAAAAAEADRGPAWASLSPVQKQALAPLQHDWPSIDELRKQKWLEVAARFPAMPPEERSRVQARMTEWARLTPAERASARLQFQEVSRLPADERQTQWQAYQALTPEERLQLAQRAKPASRPASAAPARASAGSEAATGKRNLVQATALPPSRAVGPTVVQARPGSTTTPMGTRVAPPAHQQDGMPKIAATPGFVDPTTLLPQRGPQGAAASPARPSSAPRNP